jgi:hypothetical protein
MSTGSRVSGRIVDRETKQGINEALIIVLKPGVSTADFIRQQERAMALTSGRSDRDGRFDLPDALPAGGQYSLIVVARGYADAVIEDGLRIATNAGPETKLVPIRLDRE